MNFLCLQPPLSIYGGRAPKKGGKISSKLQNHGIESPNFLLDFRERRSNFYDSAAPDVRKLCLNYLRALEVSKKA